jgi:hypothetical protein
MLRILFPYSFSAYLTFVLQAMERKDVRMLKWRESCLWTRNTALCIISIWHTPTLHVLIVTTPCVLLNAMIVTRD